MSLPTIISYSSIFGFRTLVRHSMRLKTMMVAGTTKAKSSHMFHGVTSAGLHTYALSPPTCNVPPIPPVSSAMQPWRSLFHNLTLSQCQAASTRISSTARPASSADSRHNASAQFLHRFLQRLHTPNVTKNAANTSSNYDHDWSMQQVSCGLICYVYIFAVAYVTQACLVIASLYNIM